MFKIILTAVVLASLGLVSCATGGAPVKQQAYAALSNHRNYEYEFPVVWKGIEATFQNFSFTRDPKEVGELAMNKITERTLETDWVFGQSRDKYIEYKVNGSPRKQYLQNKIKYTVTAKRQIGGVLVTVKTEEQLERLKKDGTPDGYDNVSNVDPAKAAEILDKIGNSILSLAP